MKKVIIVVFMFINIGVHSQTNEIFSFETMELFYTNDTWDESNGMFYVHILDSSLVIYGERKFKFKITKHFKDEYSWRMHAYLDDGYYDDYKWYIEINKYNIQIQSVLGQIVLSNKESYYKFEKENKITLKPFNQWVFGSDCSEWYNYNTMQTAFEDDDIYKELGVYAIHISDTSLVISGNLYWEYIVIDRKIFEDVQMVTAFGIIDGKLSLRRWDVRIYEDYIELLTEGGQFIFDNDGTHSFEAKDDNYQ